MLQTSADVVVFVDSDVVVHAMRSPACAMRSHATRAWWPSWDRMMTASPPAARWAAFRNLLHHVVHQRSAGDVRSFWAGLGAVRRQVFDAVGGFDADRYPHPSIEDVELGGRLARHGRIVLDPELRGTHLKEWTLTSMVHTDFRRRGVPWVELLVKQRRLPATLNLGTRERASAAAALALAWGVLRRRPLAVVTGIGAEVALNLDLVTLLHRRIGARGVIAGIGLHMVHQLTAVAAVPAGLVEATRR